MAVIEYWLQLENHAWDLCPNPMNIDRMTGQPPNGGGPQSVQLTSPVTGATSTRTMNMPLTKDGALHSALILRRYTRDWALPDDRKVNPWDVNEPDPTDTGTMGTIPGPVLECQVGDSVIVHYRNLDLRTSQGALLPIESRTHSVHPHGFVFDRFSDGAYPLAPPDPNQPIPVTESAAWATVQVSDLKQGDRVPPPHDPNDPIATAATYDYHWNTFGWPTTAGVWLYHDHSVCDMENVEHGAIGIIVIHNPEDPHDVDIRDPQDPAKYVPELLPAGAVNTSPVRQDGAASPVFVDPPPKALYLQLFHSLGHNSSMTINGRKYLGNTPTVLAGPETLMRFGVVGMNMNDFHTFHLHGHRWIIPGPDGNTPDTIQSSPMIRAVSQFEDTRLFGPANSFVFTIDSRSTSSGAVPSFMRAGGPDHADGKGEWHMHCHVLMHMDDGMMGSLVIAEANDPAAFQSATLVCPKDVVAPQTIVVNHTAFTPQTLTVAPDSTVTFDFQERNHTVETVTAQNATPIAIDDNGAPVPAGEKHTVTIKGTSGGVIHYQCGIHLSQMPGEIHVL